MTLSPSHDDNRGHDASDASDGVHANAFHAIPVPVPSRGDGGADGRQPLPAPLPLPVPAPAMATEK